MCFVKIESSYPRVALFRCTVSTLTLADQVDESDRFAWNAIANMLLVSR